MCNSVSEELGKTGHFLDKNKHAQVHHKLKLELVEEYHEKDTVFIYNAYMFFSLFSSETAMCLKFDKK